MILIIGVPTILRDLRVCDPCERAKSVDLGLPRRGVTSSDLSDARVLRGGIGCRFRMLDAA